MLLLCEFFDNMRADKPGTAGYDILHGTILSTLCDLHSTLTYET
jgi:hypothetical protein